MARIVLVLSLLHVGFYMLSKVLNLKNTLSGTRKKKVKNLLPRPRQINIFISPKKYFFSALYYNKTVILRLMIRLI